MKFGTTFGKKNFPQKKNCLGDKKKTGKGEELKTYKPSPLNKILTKNSDALKKILRQIKILLEKF